MKNDSESEFEDAVDTLFEPSTSNFNGGNSENDRKISFSNFSDNFNKFSNSSKVNILKFSKNFKILVKFAFENEYASMSFRNVTE